MRRRRPFAAFDLPLIVAGSTLVGCASILGYDDLKDRPADSGADATGDESPRTATGGSSGSSSGSSSGAMRDAATCTPLASVPSSDAVPYVPVQQVLHACQQGQINTFVTSCASAAATSDDCTTWQNDPGNASCQACILPANGDTLTGAGAVLVNAQNSFFTENVPGCLALVDPSHGPKCATELAPQIQCENVGCANCPSGTVRSCFDEITAPSGACGAYTIPDCAKDVLPEGGTFNNQCSGATAAQGVVAVLNVICGTGT